jgi:hypothetical protein
LERAWETKSLRGNQRLKALRLSDGEVDYVLSQGQRQGLWVKQRQGGEVFWMLPKQETNPGEAQQAVGGE